MATCKDCFHFEVCDSGRHIGEYEIDDGVYTEGVEKECSAFRDKGDFVEVVRCKDCKKFIEKGEEYILNDVFGICEKSRTGFFDDGEEVYGNDFCSYGERRDT